MPGAYNLSTFEGFFAAVKEIVCEQAKKGEIRIPRIYLVKNGELSIGLLLCDKVLWQPYTASLVIRADADAYVFVSEMEMTYKVLDGKEVDAPITKDDDMLAFFGYHKDGTQKTDNVYISKTRELLFNKQPPKTSIDMVVGDVYPMVRRFLSRGRVAR